MNQPRWRRALNRLGLELWLPLPLLGFVFWIGGGQVMDQVLSHTYSPRAQLQANTQPRFKRSVRVLSASAVRSIEVVVAKDQGVSQVKVKPARSALKELTFVFPVTEFAQVEAAIARELGLPPEVVRGLMHYQIQ